MADNITSSNTPPFNCDSQTVAFKKSSKKKNQLKLISDRHSLQEQSRKVKGSSLYREITKRYLQVTFMDMSLHEAFNKPAVTGKLRHERYTAKLTNQNSTRSRCRSQNRPSERIPPIHGNARTFGRAVSTPSTPIDCSLYLLASDNGCCASPKSIRGAFRRHCFSAV